MKPDKAAEFYSGYFEGTLPQGIRSQFERLLESNPQVAADYADFVDTMSSLDVLQHQPVEVPADLHEMIMRRLDRDAYESKKAQRTSFFGGWRLALIGGLAVVGIAGAVMSLNQQKNGSFQASTLPEAQPKYSSTISFELKGTVPTISVEAQRADSVVVRQVEEDTTLETEAIRPGQRLEIPVTNRNIDGSLISVTATNAKQPIWLALPPAEAIEVPDKGNGDATELAMALARKHKIVVVADVANPSKMLSWEFTGKGIAEVTVPGSSITIEVKSGYIRLRD